MEHTMDDQAMDSVSVTEYCSDSSADDVSLADSKMEDLESPMKDEFSAEASILNAITTVVTEKIGAALATPEPDDTDMDLTSQAVDYEGNSDEEVGGSSSSTVEEVGIDLNTVDEIMDCFVSEMDAKPEIETETMNITEDDNAVLGPAVSTG